MKEENKVIIVVNTQPFSQAGTCYLDAFGGLKGDSGNILRSHVQVEESTEFLFIRCQIRETCIEFLIEIPVNLLEPYFNSVPTGAVHI